LIVVAVSGGGFIHNVIMILRRLGNKSKIAHEIIKYFPQHEIYIEPFFGAGGMFFNKPKAKINILNDLDNDVFNLFDLIKSNDIDLLEKLELTPYSEFVFQNWKEQQETERVWKAIRFIYLSNFGFMGQGSSLKLDSRNHKENAILNLRKTKDFLKDCSVKFTNNDFRKAIKSISLSEENNKNRTFFYCDPPYLGTDNNYSNSFTEQDSVDLFDVLLSTGCNFGISEFDNPFIIEQAEKRGLFVNVIGERRNLKNSRTEILITNYKKQKSLFD
jgi:DNA adenine methylase